MSESPVTPTTGTTGTQPPPAQQPKPYWLYRFAAWVGIVAGIVFVVAVVFFSGAKLTHHCGGHGGHHHHRDHSMMHGGGHHQHGPAQGDRDTPGGPGPGESPRSVTPPPAPPGR